MTRATLPHPEALREILSYDPGTGRLTWLERPSSAFEPGKQTSQHNANTWNGKWAGREAFTAVSGGYRVGHLCGRQMRAHRVIWALVHGRWPQDQIDHINGVRSDNRLENLREVTSTENARNAKRLSTNTSGVTGVYWVKREKKWLARIRVNDVKHVLGYFSDFDAAVQARKAAEERFGFHPNHGRAA